MKLWEQFKSFLTENSTLICLLVGLYEFFKFMIFITMTCYNAYDLGIVRALHAIWLMFIPRDYPNDDGEKRVRQQSRNDG